jgi:farnesyl diphosphate synthase
MTSFDQEAQLCAADIQAGLEQLLTSEKLSGPGPAPERLLAAMRHGTLNGGKRMRPLLLRQTAAIFGVPTDKLLNASLAVELVHCYSLIHDDLPAMDDDETRRGKPTVHMLFDEATAILAGDTLLTHAFALLADPACHPDPSVRIALVAELAAGSGAGGMAGGQMRDLEGENARVTEQEISTMQAMKTGALIRASVRMGALIGGASDEELETLTTYASLAGQAFQLADDILDETASEAQMGKATAKDANRGKPTLVAAIGLEKAQKQLGNLVGEAVACLEPFGDRANALKATARYFAERES